VRRRTRGGALLCSARRTREVRCPHTLPQ
jgi:hypothetical protein